MIICPECGMSVRTFVDGREMTEDEIRRMKYAPKKIERRLTHMRWCTKQEALFRNLNAKSNGHA